ncbi:MAG: polyamine aminopropyltransferase [Gammaproteobacteria bacterium]
MMDDSEWFVEPAPKAGCSIGLRIRRKLDSVESPFQKIEIYETEDFGKLMVIDGCIMLTERDHFIYHEMLVHPALWTHPDPVSVVIVGGGDGGTLTEVVKHAGVQEVVQVEIDRAVTDLALRHFPEFAPAQKDARVRLVFEDAIRWIERAPEASIDVLLIDSTDPIGPAEGLFEKGFYEICRSRLRPDGILALQSESPFLYPHLVRGIHEKLASAGFRNRKLFPFPQPTYPSGFWSVTLASERTPLDAFRTAADTGANPVLRYYSPASHRSLLTGLPVLFANLTGGI